MWLTYSSLCFIPFVAMQRLRPTIIRKLLIGLLVERYYNSTKLNIFSGNHHKE